jgi:hypothetical protein
MTKSLRARLFVGLTAVILLAGSVGGVFAYIWAFDEAIEMQDSILIQIGGLLQNGSVKNDQSLHGVDADAEVVVMELGTAPRGSAEDRQLYLDVIITRPPIVRRRPAGNHYGGRFAYIAPESRHVHCSHAPEIPGR